MIVRIWFLIFYYCYCVNIMVCFGRDGFFFLLLWIWCGWKLVIIVKLFFSGCWFVVVCVFFSIIFFVIIVDLIGCCYVIEVVWCCGLWLVWWWLVWVFINFLFFIYYNIIIVIILYRMNVYIFVILYIGVIVWFLCYYNI